VSKLPNLSGLVARSNQGEVSSAGVRNKSTGKPWQEGARVLIWSATKGLAVMMLAVAQSSRLARLREARLPAAYWHTRNDLLAAEREFLAPSFGQVARFRHVDLWSASSFNEHVFSFLSVTLRSHQFVIIPRCPRVQTQLIQ
jgi:hypothetical protein